MRRPQDVSRRSQDFSSGRPRDGQIGSLGDVLGTNICRLGNLDEYADVGTHWTALFYNRSELVYFGSFGVEYVPEEIKQFVGNKNIKANIF